MFRCSRPTRLLDRRQGWSVRTHSRMEEEKCFLTFTCALDGDLLISLLPSLVRSRWSAAEELDGDGGELVVELEDAAVHGVGVDDQLGALDAPVQVLGESRGH